MKIKITFSMERIEMMASTIPDAPSKWPIAPFVLLTANFFAVSPNTSFIA